MQPPPWQDRHKLVPAVYVLLRKDDQILIMKRQNTGYRDGYYSLPAGHFDGGEPAVQVAVREAKEEVGVDIDPKDLRLIHTQHAVSETGDHERINLYFETSKWTGGPFNAEPEKCGGVRWAGLNDLPANLVPPVEELVRHLKSGSSYSHLGF